MTTAFPPTLTSLGHEPTRDDIAGALYATLGGVATSKEAIAACLDIGSRALKDGLSSPIRSQREAMTAIISDLTGNAAKDLGQWSYRSLGSERFTGGRIGYRPFTACFKALTGQGLIETYGGTQQYTSFGGGPQVVAWRRATRFRATPRLLSALEGFGIAPDNWRDHFALVEPVALPAASNKPLPCPVELRRAKEPMRRKGRKGAKATPLPIDISHPDVARIHAQMTRINAFIADQQIEAFGPVVFRRVYQAGDKQDFAWDCGGRLTVNGGGGYQNLKPAERATITINGEAVVELDIRACHLTILCGLGYLPANIIVSGKDVYEVEGIPRKVVKQWVTMTLCHTGRHTRWPQEAKASLSKTLGVDLSKAFPIKTTGDAILASLPILDSAGKVLGGGWGMLQNVESEVVVRTMDELAFIHSVPCLPVHDSIIVPASKVGVARSVLSKYFKELTTLEPYLDVK